MKILHYYPVWLPLTQTWMYHQVRFLPADVERHVVCETVDNLDQFEVPNLHVHAAHSMVRPRVERLYRKYLVRYSPRHLVRTARMLRGEILHSHFGNIGWANLDAARDAALRHVVSFYGMDVNHLPMRDPRWRDRYAELFATTDRVLCEGPNMAAAVMRLGCPPDKVRIHHLGVDVDAIEFQPRAWDGTSPLRVLVAASFQEKKGIPYGLHALALLRKEVPVEVTIIGDATPQRRSRQERGRIMEMIRRNGLADVTRLLGYVSYARLFEEAYRHHVFLAPSVSAHDGDTEGGAPVTIIEMAATGMPVVSTLHGDIPEVLENGRSGLLSPERDVMALLGHLHWLVGHPDQWAGIAGAARRRVEAEFNARVQGVRLSRLYREIVA